MFNLIDKLPVEDKEKIIRYINLYGVEESRFIGLDAWLEPWAKNKIKLYKMLGNSFVYKVPFQCEKPRAEITRQINDLLEENDFVHAYEEWVWPNMYEEEIFTRDQSRALNSFIWCGTLEEDKTSVPFKFKKEGATRELQLQAGTKPMRALSKVLEYFKDDKRAKKLNLQSKFEEFRIKHSQIFNDKTVKGNVCISIHPLDFITMSDNASNWQSCMNWSKDSDGGCYHVGTIEMMNSNNVVCCYVESKEPYYFGRKKDGKTEEYRWNNKKWRQLFYVTKDIIVSGKPYPFEHEVLTKHILNTIRELAKQNLDWEYTFGPELYKDMKHINSMRSMNKVRRYIANKDTKKHNIIFDTKGMYNDMLNDNHTPYWCVRNKVKHNKIISYSGKAPCLCCGEPIISEITDEFNNYYNDRYDNTGSSICEECKSSFSCSVCDKIARTEKMYSYTMNGRTYLMCESCFKNKVRICPECQKPMIIDLRRPKMYVQMEDDINREEASNSCFDWDWEEDDNYRELVVKEDIYQTLKPVFMHNSCLKKIPGVVEDKWYGRWDTFYFKMIPKYKADKYKNYSYSDLVVPAYEENMELTEMNDASLFSSNCWW